MRVPSSHVRTFPPLLESGTMRGVNPLILLIPAVLLLNYALWRRRGRGWQRHVAAFKAVVQPYVPEPVLDVLVLQPAGAVGRQACAEQSRGLRTIFGGMSGELGGAIAEHRAGEQADRETLPPMTALAVTEHRCHLLPVTLAGGVWSAGPVERSFDRAEAAYDVEGRALTIQVTITVGAWRGEYEIARDPARYGDAVLDRLRRVA